MFLEAEKNFRAQQQQQQQQQQTKKIKLSIFYKDQTYLFSRK